MDHDHSHAPASFGRAFAIGVALNTAFVVIEAIYGVFGHSVALLADAGHNLSDVLGLASAWTASVLAQRAPSARYTYGLRGSSILAALFNSSLLLIAVGAIALESLRRLAAPEPVAGNVVMIVAAVGIVVNGVTAWLFAAGRNDDINLRAAFWHMAGDAVIAAGVVVAGLVIALTGWTRLDPLASLAISAIIVWGTWGLMREALDMSMDAVPARIDPEALRAFLASQTGVADVHDLHVWPVSTTEIALTCHVVMPAGHPGDAFLHALAEQLAEQFGIRHPTVQIDIDSRCVCALAPQHSGSNHDHAILGMRGDHSH